MATASGAFQSRPGAGLTSLATGRGLFYALVIWGAALIWLAPHPPLIDFPQHAGQASLLRALLTGQSPWADIVRINPFTPYLVGYGATTLLSFVMPAHAAIALMMGVAFVGFVAASVQLRKELGGDARLDWLFIAGFFGFAWKWGFFSYVLACPVGILFLIFARRYAIRPSVAAGARLAGLGALLFICHGLVFVFSALIGSLFLLNLDLFRFPRRLLRLAPYVVLAGLLLAYEWVTIRADPATHALTNWGGFGHRFLFFFAVYPWGLSSRDGYFGLLSLAVVAALGLLGVRLNKGAYGWWTPAAAVLAVWIVVPSNGLGLGLLFERFSIFALPSVAWALTKSERPFLTHPVAARVGSGLLILVCCVQLASATYGIVRFAAETKGVDAIIAAIPRDRALVYLPFDPYSPASRTGAYRHYGAWYQAENGGFTYPNFAEYLPQVARYRRGYEPILRVGAESDPSLYSLDPRPGRAPGYILMRGLGGAADAMAAKLMHDPRCRVDLAQSNAEWRLLKVGTCR